MRKERGIIEGIPSLLWGEPSENVYIHIHGKMSRKESAESFAIIADGQGWQTLSFDLPQHGERQGSAERCDVWNGVHDLDIIADEAFAKFKRVRFYACSIGAYFALNAYAGKPFEQALLQSPIADMPYLIGQMMQWFNVTPERLEAEKEIDNPIDPLRWDYYQYAFSHSVLEWPIPTAILYGAKDHMQSREAIQHFADAHHCELTVSENSEHPFMSESDYPIVEAWLKAHIKP